MFSKKGISPSLKRQRKYSGCKSPISSLTETRVDDNSVLDVLRTRNIAATLDRLSCEALVLTKMMSSLLDQYPERQNGGDLVSYAAAQEIYGAVKELHGSATMAADLTNQMTFRLQAHAQNCCEGEDGVCMCKAAKKELGMARV